MGGIEWALHEIDANWCHSIHFSHTIFPYISIRQRIWVAVLRRSHSFFFFIHLSHWSRAITFFPDFFFLLSFYFCNENKPYAPYFCNLLLELLKSVLVTQEKYGESFVSQSRNLNSEKKYKTKAWQTKNAKNVDKIIK